MPRIVSLIASATEIVAALGFEDHLVGRSHECDYPPKVKRLPVCTAPKFNVEGSSYAIDQRVKAVLQEGLGVYRVHADQLRELRPDVPAGLSAVVAKMMAKEPAQRYQKPIEVAQALAQFVKPGAKPAPAGVGGAEKG